MSMEREKMHRLVERIPETEVTHALRYLQYLEEIGEDPVRRALDNAPLDDEPETEEERAAVEEGKADLRAGRTLSTEELKRELGL